MTLTDYIRDSHMAFCSDIFNTHPSSVEEMSLAVKKAYDSIEECRKIIGEWKSVSNPYIWAVEDIKEYSERVKNLTEFKNTRVANLISQYCSHNTPELLDAIKKEIEITGNPYDIFIMEEEYDWSKGELMYGWSSHPQFNIQKLEVYYLFDSFDIDEDIENNKRYLELAKKQKAEAETDRNNMIAKYGTCLLEYKY